jgi:ribosome-binding factor A
MAGNQRRPDRVAEGIREEIARTIARDVQDPRITSAFVTVTGVDVSRDLRTAKVYISIMGDDAVKRAAADGLNDLAPSLRGPVGRALRLRSAPEISFKFDDSIAYAARIESLLSQIHKDDTPVDGADAAHDD